MYNLTTTQKDAKYSYTKVIYRATHETKNNNIIIYFYRMESYIKSDCATSHFVIAEEYQVVTVQFQLRLRRQNTNRASNMLKVLLSRPP